MKKILCLSLLTILLLSSAVINVACGGDSEETSPQPMLETTPSQLESTAETESASNPYEVTITADGFSPQTLTVPVGTKVTWFNQDPTDSRRHWVTSKTKIPDTRVIPVGAHMSFTFKEAGVYEYYCMYHRDETGTVIVE